MQDQSQRSESIQTGAEGWSHSDFSRVPYDVFTREDSLDLALFFCDSSASLA